MMRFGRPPSWIVNMKFLMGGALQTRVLYHHANFLEIGVTVAEMSRFFAFLQVTSKKIHG